LDIKILIVRNKEKFYMIKHVHLYVHLHKVLRTGIVV